MPRTTDHLTSRLHTLTATEIVQTIAEGKTSCEAVAHACLEHIHAHEPHVQAWQYTVTTEFANRHPGKTRHPMDPQG